MLMTLLLKTMLILAVEINYIITTITPHYPRIGNQRTIVIFLVLGHCIWSISLTNLFVTYPQLLGVWSYKVKREWFSIIEMYASPFPVAKIVAVEKVDKVLYDCSLFWRWLLVQNLQHLELTLIYIHFFQKELSCVYFVLIWSLQTIHILFLWLQNLHTFFLWCQVFETGVSKVTFAFEGWFHSCQRSCMYFDYTVE